MEIIIRLLLLTTIIVKCNAVSYLEQLLHIMNTRRDGQGVNFIPSRRFDVNQGQSSVILGAPSMPSHLPEAEAVLPGHTLIRPAIGMLKSAVKFPHKELENGAGVYGNINNLGIRYDGTNERVLYTGFRRMPQDYIVIMPETFPKKYESYRARLSESKKPSIIKLISKLINDSLRRNKPKRTLKDEVDDYSDDKIESQEKNVEDHSSSEENPKKLKNPLFWESKDAYNHIKINPEAPDITELLPEDAIKKLQDWWFYNQEDFAPFEE